MGIKFEDEVRALLLLGPLSYTWETFKVTVWNCTPNGIVTWNLVKNKVINEESRKTVEMDSSSSDSEVFVSQSWGRSKSRGPTKKEGGSRRKSKVKHIDLVCHNYHEKGHIK
jgi:hypothetical protein